MAIVGKPVWERRSWRSLVDQIAVNLLRDETGTERHITAADPFGQRQHVWSKVPMFKREASSGTAKAGDHFVENEQYPVLAADRLDHRPVFRRRYDGPPRAHDRLTDEGGHGVRPLLQQVFLQRPGTRQLTGGIPQSELTTITMWRRNEAEAGHQGGRHVPVALNAGGAQGTHRYPVIGLIPGDDFEALGLTIELKIVPGDLEGALIGLRAAGGIEDAGQMRWGHVDEPFGQFNRRQIRKAEKARRKGELADLLAHRIADLRAAVADVDIPETRQAIDELSPLQ